MRLLAPVRPPTSTRHRPSRSLRWRLALRRPSTQWALLAVAALIAVAWTHQREAALDRRADVLDTRPAWVVATDLAPGAEVTATMVERRDVPVDLIPEGAVDGDAAPEGRVRRPMRRGEILLAHALDDRAASGLAARLEATERAIAVPLGPASLELSRDDVVDVVAFDGDGRPDAPTSSVIAAGARVLDRADGQVTLAVAADRVPALADALAVGQVQLALRGG